MVIINICIMTKFYKLMFFSFWVTRVEEEEEEEEQNSIIAPYIYNARHHANPYILSTTIYLVITDTFSHREIENV